MTLKIEPTAAPAPESTPVENITIVDAPAAPVTDTTTLTTADVGDVASLLDVTAPAPPVTTTETPAASEAETAAAAAPTEAPAPAPAPAEAPTPAPVVSAPPAPVAPPAPTTVAAATVTTPAAAPTDSPAADFAQSVTDRAAAQRVEALGIGSMTPQLQAAILDVLDNGSNVAKGLISRTLDYLSKMGPRNMVAKERGETIQIQFYRLFQNAINNGGTDFRKMFNVFLRIIFETKDTGAFQLPLVMRFLPSMNLSADDRQAFQHLIFLFRQTAGVESRAIALKQVDLNKATSKGLMPAGQQRLLTFFQA